MKTFSSIRVWALNNGIYDSGDLKTQTLKLNEEVGELSESILKKDRKEFIDAVGDCVIVLTNMVELSNDYWENQEAVRIEDCIELAYSTIKNRKGKMSNGTFVKNETV